MLQDFNRNEIHQPPHNILRAVTKQLQERLSLPQPREEEDHQVDSKFIIPGSLEFTYILTGMIQQAPNLFTLYSQLKKKIATIPPDIHQIPPAFFHNVMDYIMYLIKKISAGNSEVSINEGFTNINIRSGFLSMAITRGNSFQKKKPSITFTITFIRTKLKDRDEVFSSADLELARLISIAYFTILWFVTTVTGRRARNEITENLLSEFLSRAFLTPEETTFQQNKHSILKIIKEASNKIVNILTGPWSYNPIKALMLLQALPSRVRKHEVDLTQAPYILEISKLINETINRIYFSPEESYTSSTPNRNQPYPPASTSKKDLNISNFPLAA